MRLLQCKVAKHSASALARGSELMPNGVPSTPDQAAKMHLSTAPHPFSAQALFLLLSVLCCAPALQAQPLIHEAQAGLVAPAAVAAAKPKYSSSDIGRAFGFMDGNKDGKVSREEAAGFRNVAKYFDAADTNKNQALSREEFERALNSDKKR